ncbi:MULTISPECIES: putative quinol monooxygenase [Lentisalinibacter]|uniref:putative quinol monooxygenase n=1 Tax=Lentisalinibacter TaxID=3382081 RepID=UPI00386C07CF
MPKIVIAEFPAQRDKVPEVEATLKEALVDTRAFDGCIRIDTYFEEAAATFVLIEEWQSFEHYDRYLKWRMETGLADLLDMLLEGGAQSFRVRKLEPRDV